jgi:uncharacterized protein (TIGR01777 family)
MQMTSDLSFSDTSECVLVTGASGFIGSLLVKALVKNRQRVIVLTRHPEKAALQFDKNVSCIANMNELSTEQQIDVVVNLAGARILGWRWTAGRKEVLRQSRIGTTKNVIAWIARATHKPRLFLSASAIGYYGIQAKGDAGLLKEDSAPQAIFMSQLCQEWEAAAQAATQYGVKVICMRFGLVLGKGGALPMMLLPIRMGVGGRLGDGQQWLSWIHVEDLLRGIAHLWQSNATDAIETYNFTAPQTVTQEVFSQTAARVLHRPSIFPTPAILMQLLLGEQADLLLEGQRVTPAGLQASGFEFVYPDLQSALENLTQANKNNPE